MSPIRRIPYQEENPHLKQKFQKTTVAIIIKNQDAPAL